MEGTAGGTQPTVSQCTLEGVYSRVMVESRKDVKQ
jgi:hypothetical protein